MSFDQHATACVERDAQIGADTSIGCYSVIRSGVTLGRRCTVGDHVVLAESITTGDDVVCLSGSYIGPCAKIGNRVHVGPCATVDSRDGAAVEIRDQAVLGAHTTIQAGIVIGERAIVEPGAVVTKNVPATAVVSGNPAKIVKYVAASSAPTVTSWQLNEHSLQTIATSVRRVTLHQLPLVEDLRGNLSFGEASRHVPFEVKRYFITFDVSTEEARGEHAHRTLEQFLICVHGCVHIVADDGFNREEFILDRPNLALYLPPMVWAVQYRFSRSAVLMVLCSEHYNPDDYIRDYSEFLAMRALSSGPDHPSSPGE